MVAPHRDRAVIAGPGIAARQLTSILAGDWGEYDGLRCHRSAAARQQRSIVVLVGGLALGCARTTRAGESGCKAIARMAARDWHRVPCALFCAACSSIWRKDTGGAG